jgi:hypothetical protein
MKKIKLTKGYCALVDDNDFEWLSQWNWYFEPRECTGYAARTEGTKPKQVKIYMHNRIAGTPTGMTTDHIDHNGLNNQRGNLRICTQSENHMNSQRQANNTSGYKGVTWNKNEQKWKARIQKNRKEIHLGYFDTAEKAAYAYNDAARKFFGEFANLNKI